MTTAFVHLRLHSEYSIVDGLIEIKALMERMNDFGMPAVAITDQCNVFAAIKFYRAAHAAGIKPILGADIRLANPVEGQPSFSLTLLCQTLQGYHNLVRLISRAYLEGQQQQGPLIHFEWLAEASDGLIVLSGGLHGNVGQALLHQKESEAETLLANWAALFPNRFYIELTRTGRAHEEAYIQAVLPLALKLHLPVVATNDVRFLDHDDFDAHEARVCIHEGTTLEDDRRAHLYSPAQHFRSAEEMTQRFSDIPPAIANTIEIAKRCNVQLNLGHSSLPNFPIPTDETVDAFFERQAKEGLAERLATIFPENNSPDNFAHYHQRLHTEVKIIEGMGFPGYFLIVADFIRWAKSQGISVGPGRGSGAGSLVAYALGITDLDPIEHDLLFERFLNPERVSMADFDIDFCMEGRDRVIEYVAQRYGRESVSQIITFGTMAARAVVRDVGRVLGYPYGFVDKLAKLIPFELGMTLNKALDDEVQLHDRYHAEEDVKRLIDLALKLEGVPRNVGKHAGGVVIAPSVLTDFTALYCEPDGSNLVTQFDKDDVEKVGLVKFDFLGLRTLTIIDWAVHAINAHRAKMGETTLNIIQLPLNDAPTFQLLKACSTTAVFQLESRGMKDLIKRLQPDCFNDIVALVALFRPGPLQSGMVDDYIQRKHGHAMVEYLHPDLEPILKPTYGVILYQEQVMQIAQVLAGYTLGGADLLRRAMGKKKPEEMAEQRAIFVEGAKTKGVDPQQASQIFDLMEKFADYGFNKSHSAAYALLAYQTAWLKAHYPAEFMAAVLSSDMDNTNKVVRFIHDCQALHIGIASPSINRSAYAFTVINEGEILYGLGAIKGVGSTAIESILATRENKGAFKSLFEFCQRVDTRKVNRKVLEALIKSGAFDELGQHRAILMATLDKAIQFAEQKLRDEQQGQHDLFGASAAMTQDEQHEYVHVATWPDETLLAGEKESLGWYVSGHPIARFETELSHFVTAPLNEMPQFLKQTVVCAGFLTQLKIMHTKSGLRMAFLTLEDKFAHIDCVVFSDTFETTRDILVKDQLLIVEGEMSEDDFTGGHKIIARGIKSLTQMRQIRARSLTIQLVADQLSPSKLNHFIDALHPYRGGDTPVCIDYVTAEAQGLLQLGRRWSVRPEQALLDQLVKLLGSDYICLNYE